MVAMNASCFLLFGIIYLLDMASGQQQTSQTDCGECDHSSCNPPEECLAGMVKDTCDCCYVCARKEGQLCDHSMLGSDDSAFGKCGENLECRIRTDLDPEDPPEATCFCTQTQPNCGSNGVTYENICQLTEARYKLRNGLRAVSREPCRKAPTITSAPQNQRNNTGSYVAMLCEADGWPAPAMKWTAHKPGKESVTLPGTNSRIVVHSRGGSAYGDVTSWLLITHLLEVDDATYTCVAENDMGSASSSAHVYVVL
uniref:U5-Hexatoxin-Hc1a_1 n=1 Tax=Hadronyche cerberea TaxID=1107879 RepID=A0A4Q8K414_HADCE